MFTLNLINLYMTQHDCTATPDWRNVEPVQYSILIHFCNTHRLFAVGLVFSFYQMEKEVWIIFSSV